VTSQLGLRHSNKWRSNWEIGGEEHQRRDNRKRIMISRNLARRLEQLEAQLMPAGDEPVKVLVIEFVSGPDRQVVSSIEMKLQGAPRTTTTKRW